MSHGKTRSAEGLRHFLRVRWARLNACSGIHFTFDRVF